VQVIESLDTELMVAQILPMSKNTRLLTRIKMSETYLTRVGGKSKQFLTDITPCVPITFGSVVITSCSPIFRDIT